MKIENLRSEKKADRARATATVIWEDCDRPPQEIFFETHETFARDISCNPHAFFVASTISAMHHGEERIFMDAEICPELRDGLITAMALIRHWFNEEDRKPIQIEVKTRSDVLTPHVRDSAGFFFSGGIDSLATLRANRLNFPLEHPRSIKYGLLVYGLEIDDPGNFELVVSSLSEVARDAGITLLPVYTNVRSLDDDWTFWSDIFESSVFAAVAHAFTQRLGIVSIASSFDIPRLHPHGSHPMLDPNYSSSDLLIRHDGIALSRLDKTKLIVGWDVALQHIRVCNRTERIQHGILNCGECEKCARTMLALLALGVLDQTHAFPRHDVSEELVRCLNKTTFPFYGELLAPLAEKGRHDLVRAIEHRIAVYLDREPGLKAWTKRFDRKYFYGSLARFRKAIHNRSVRS